MSNEVKTNLESIFQSFQEMIKVETVVGEALHIGDAILVPFVDVTFGFGSGGFGGKGDTAHESAGGGGEITFPCLAEQSVGLAAGKSEAAGRGNGYIIIGRNSSNEEIWRVFCLKKSFAKEGKKPLFPQVARVCCKLPMLCREFTLKK